MTDSPLYVNHSRTVPAPGDVVSDDDEVLSLTWHYVVDSEGEMYWSCSYPDLDDRLPPRRRLLVDGKTGRIVQ